jgi:hypothetical protein
LHAQLYLLACDRKRYRFGAKGSNGRWRLDLALRAAMLTDLYLTGHVEDRMGKAYPTGTARHEDPVLHEALNEVTGQDWTRWIAHGQHDARRIVAAQLEAAGWMGRRVRRRFGILPTPCLELYDDDVVSALAYSVTDALNNVIDDLPADPRPLALGLLAVEAQLPVVNVFVENSRRRERLREMTLAAIEPILGLHQAILVQSAVERRDWNVGGFDGGF